MVETRPFASLSPSLLARKGGARPAMRPQLAPLPQFQDATARQIDDLGWNDMGTDVLPGEVEADRAVPFVSSVPVAAAALTSAPAEVVSIHAAVVPADPPVPEVVRQREAAEVSIARIERPRRSARADGRRAAFTLRLDADRHLQLRLACTVSGRSAQQIVTEALDRLLAEMPEIAALADNARKHN